MKCYHCQAAIEPGEEREHRSRMLCEDCYLEALSAVKTCDPWAVYCATSLERHSGAPTLTLYRPKSSKYCKRKEDWNPRCCSKS